MPSEKPLDITLVSGARPGLLQQTLESFSQRLFKNFTIGTCYVNIDPFEGGPDEVAACEVICRSFFPNVTVRTPETSHFTRAVRWLWQQPQNDWFFHMEDDWVLDRDVTFEEFSQATTAKVMQISLMTREKNWGYRSQYHYEPSRLLILGKDFGKSLNKKRPIFGTSPGFLKRDFAHHCAAMMLDELDPEKQLNSLNPALNRYTAKFRNRFIGKRREFVAVDIGRQHRDDKGIIKSIVKGNSVWIRQEGS